MGKLFSIIIPVFNTEKYIERCLLSCLQQDISSEDYEIIIVNDGSTDKSLEVIRHYSATHTNIVLIDKKNEGVSSARNAGLMVARGDLIWFIDSDDWIERNCLNKIIKIFKSYSLDALQVGYYSVFDTLIPCNDKYLINTNVLSPEDYVNPQFFTGAVWTTIFKRDIVLRNGIRFDEKLVISEDQLFLLEVFFHCKRLKREKILLYYYYGNPNSAIRTAASKDIFQAIEKITKSKYYNSFTAYCRYSISNKLLLFLKSPKKDLLSFHRLIKPHIGMIEANNYPRGSRQFRILVYYSLFGLFFLYQYTFYSILKKQIQRISL